MENPFGDPWEEPEAAVRTPTEVPAALLEGLNPQQRAAVECLTGPLLVVAGPGSGKTRVLTHRIAALIASQQAWPRQVLAVTFTNKAAAEMRERLSRLVGEDSLRGMWVSTFHSACLRLLRANPASSGLAVGFNVIDAGEARTVLRHVLAELGRSAEASDAKAAQSTISWAKNAGDIGFVADLDASLVEVAAAYQKRLGAMAAVDFDDILLRTLTMLKSHPEVLERYRKKFRHILIDEYQDTNGVQYEIARLLATGSSSFCVVGDFDQSVYSWRGATPEVINDFTHAFAGATVVKLEQNYRSTPEILELCQSIIDANPATHRAALRTDNPSGHPVRFYVAADDRDEASFVVSELRRVAPGSDAAVLMRTNAQTRVFEEELTRAAVPYAVVGALKFYDRAEVKDALAYLKLVTNPRDLVSFSRVANTPRRGLGTTALDTVSAAALSSGTPVVDLARAAAADSRFGARVTKGLVSFCAALDAVSAAAQSGPAKALLAVLRDAGLQAHFEADRSEGRERVRNLGELVTAADGFCTNVASVTVDGEVVAALTGIDQTIAFLENVALVAGGSTDAAQAKVLLMTAHASKGREFDNVWVVGVEDSLFPHFLPGESPNTAEERRLLFVACSRARDRLTLSRARQRMVFGKVVVNPASPLVAKLPPSVQRVTSQRSTPVASDLGGGYRPKSYSSHRGSWEDTRPPRRTQPEAGPRLSREEALPGLRVSHPSFGVGVVTAADQRTVTVDFDGTTRILGLDVAPLSALP